jgi:hypothetical protein
MTTNFHTVYKGKNTRQSLPFGKVTIKHTAKTTSRHTLPHVAVSARLDDTIVAEGLCRVSPIGYSANVRHLHAVLLPSKQNFCAEFSRAWDFLPTIACQVSPLPNTQANTSPPCFPFLAANSIPSTPYLNIKVPHVTMVDVGLKMVGIAIRGNT